jgi:pimeloyl-ACP methyl ester carboxylesterase
MVAFPILHAGIAAGYLAAVAPQPSDTSWKDPSLHKILHVSVAPSVELEVLDWQGSGAPLVFLAGFGNSAHVFDNFAPEFVPHFRVLGITRRGFGASTWMRPSIIESSTTPPTGLVPFPFQSRRIRLTVSMVAILSMRGNWGPSACPDLLFRKPRSDRCFGR